MPRASRCSCTLSAWLKRHEPAAFLAALLNSQPMGFYSPSQLVQDAKRHGVRVFAPDVSSSDWDSVLEKPEGLGERVVFDVDKALRRQQFYGTPVPRQIFRKTMRRAARRLAARIRKPSKAYGAGGPGVRIGLQLIKGFSQAPAERIMAARSEAPFASVDDLACRAALSRRDLEALAAGNALASIAGHRRQAWWEVTAQQPALRDAQVTRYAANGPGVFAVSRFDPAQSAPSTWWRPTTRRPRRPSRSTPRRQARRSAASTAPPGRPPRAPTAG